MSTEARSTPGKKAASKKARAKQAPSKGPGAKRASAARGAPPSSPAPLPWIERTADAALLRRKNWTGGLLILFVLLILGGTFISHSERPCTSAACKAALLDFIRAAGEKANESPPESTTIQAPQQRVVKAEWEPTIVWNAVDATQDFLFEITNFRLLGRTQFVDNGNEEPFIKSSKFVDLIFFQFVFFMFYFFQWSLARYRTSVKNWPPESHYFLGFVFTLLSLTAGLSDVRALDRTLENGDALLLFVAQIAESAGAAMLTTVLGVVAFFSFSVLEDPDTPLGWRIIRRRQARRRLRWLRLKQKRACLFGGNTTPPSSSGSSPQSST